MTNGERDWMAGSRTCRATLCAMAAVVAGLAAAANGPRGPDLVRNRVHESGGSARRLTPDCRHPRPRRMMMSFRIVGLPADRFTHLFAMSDAELTTQGAVRRTADARNPGYPCRVSLTDSSPGDELTLVNYEHHEVASPYRMRFAIYVRKGEETYDKVGEVPEQLRLRTLAVRAFDVNGM